MELFRRGKKRASRYFYTRTNNLFYALSVFLLVVVITFINDMYVRTRFIEYGSSLRLLDHLVAGIGIPIMLFLLLRSFYKRCLFYLFWCFSWETQQWIQRGYFQWDQFLVDVTGIALAVILYEKIYVRRKETVKIKSKRRKRNASIYERLC